MAEEKVPFDYKAYAADRTGWKLYTKYEREIVALFKDESEGSLDQYPLKGILNEIDGAFGQHTWKLNGKFNDAAESSLDIACMVKVKPEVKVTPRFIDVSSVLVNVFLMPNGKLHISIAQDTLSDAIINRDCILALAPDFKFLGTISFEQHPQVVELLLAEGFKFKS